MLVLVTLDFMWLTLFFIAQVLVMSVTLVLEVRRATIHCGEAEDTANARAKNLAVGFGAWLTVTAYLAQTGALRFGPMPPPLMVCAFASMAVTVALALGPVGTALVRGAGVGFLVGYQVFRVAVEIFLWWGHREGLVPVQMTWEGRNWDVVTGAMAPVAAWTGSRRVILVWNVAGLALLGNVVTVAILSAPTPFRQFWNEPANVFVTQSPFMWLPLFLVPLALFGHVVVFRWLRQPEAR